MTSWGRQYNENIVYWSPPTRDAQGDTVFSTPIELLVAYAQKSEKYVDDKGVEQVSHSIIRTDQILQPNGYTYIGDLMDLSDEEIIDPRKQALSFPIKRVMKEKSLRTKTFEYRIML